VAQTHKQIIRKTTCRGSEAYLTGYKPTSWNLEPCSATSRVVLHFQLNYEDSDHWSVRVALEYACSSQGNASMSFCFCEHCDVGLCVSQRTTLSVTTDLEQGSPSMCHYCRAYLSSGHKNSDLHWSDYSVEFSSLCYGAEDKYGLACSLSYYMRRPPRRTKPLCTEVSHAFFTFPAI
jgi:hypothetical protein